MRKSKLIVLSLFTGIAFLNISCEKTVSTSPPIEPVPFGYLYVDSNPRGMKIYEDGRNSGKVTPDSLNWLPEKEYEITLKRNLYRDTTIYVDVVEGVKQKVFVDFLANSKMRARIKCTSSPDGAKIYINDSLTNQVTPYTFTGVIPGEYKLTYTKEEHRSNTKTILAESDHESLAFLRLQDTSVWVDYNQNNSPMPEEYLNCIEIDSSNTLWMGTSEYGLVSLKNNNWSIYNSTNSPLPDDYVVDIAVDQNKTVWIATYLGLAEKNGDSWYTHTVDNSELGTNEITCLTVDKNNKLWIGTKNGLYWKSPGEDITRIHSKLDGEPFTYISAVAYDNEGEIWIGTYFRGIGRFIDGEWRVYTNDWRATERKPGYYLFKDMPSTSVTAILCEVDANRVWFGYLPNDTGPGGLGTYNQNTDKFSVNSAYTPSPTINNFYYGPQKHVWYSTNRGLVRWKNHIHRSYFIDTSVKQITIDRTTGYVWIATQGKGLIKLKEQ